MPLVMVVMSSREPIAFAEFIRYVLRKLESVAFLNIHRGVSLLVYRPHLMPTGCPFTTSSGKHCIGSFGKSILFIALSDESIYRTSVDEVE